MDFTYTPEQEHFRVEIRRWLAANLTDDLRVEDPTDERVAPDRETFERRRGLAAPHVRGGLGRASRGPRSTAGAAPP